MSNLLADWVDLVNLKFDSSTVCPILIVQNVGWSSARDGGTPTNPIHVHDQMGHPVVNTVPISAAGGEEGGCALALGAPVAPDMQ